MKIVVCPICNHYYGTDYAEAIINYGGDPQKPSDDYGGVVIGIACACISPTGICLVPENGKLNLNKGKLCPFFIWVKNPVLITSKV